MKQQHRVEIPLDKKKMVLMLLGALAFVGIGLWFVIAPPQIENSFWGHPTKLLIVGSASVVFFGLCVYVFIRKLADNKPGLVIDDTGLLDNSGGLSAGHILWTDVENISVFQVQKQKMLMLEVRNPQDYIGRQANLLKRKAMELNYRMYGTPVCIATTGLSISFDELYTLVTEKFRETTSVVQSHVGSKTQW
jgi:hypothetical protein